MGHGHLAKKIYHVGANKAAQLDIKNPPLDIVSTIHHHRVCLVMFFYLVANLIHGQILFYY